MFGVSLVGLDIVPRDPVERGEFEEVLRRIVLAPASNRPRSQNREPTKKELEQLYKLTRKNSL